VDAKLDNGAKLPPSEQSSSFLVDPK